MDLFYKDGHLSDEGLQTVVHGEPDEMQRLEASEHLSFCNHCLDRYTTLLTDDVLIAPKEPLKEPVLRRIGKKSKLVLLSRYTTVAAAAVLAVVLWSSGIFTLGPKNVAPQKDKEPFALSGTLNSAATYVNNTMNSFFGGFTIPEAPQKMEDTKSKRDELAEKEAVFKDKNTKKETKETKKEQPADANSTAANKDNK